MPEVEYRSPIPCSIRCNDASRAVCRDPAPCLSALSLLRRHQMNPICTDMNHAHSVINIMTPSVCPHNEVSLSLTYQIYHCSTSGQLHPASSNMPAESLAPKPGSASALITTKGGLSRVGRVLPCSKDPQPWPKQSQETSSSSLAAHL